MEYKEPEYTKVESNGYNFTIGKFSNGEVLLVRLAHLPSGLNIVEVSRYLTALFDVITKMKELEG